MLVADAVVPLVVLPEVPAVAPVDAVPRSSSSICAVNRAIVALSTLDRALAAVVAWPLVPVIVPAAAPVVPAVPVLPVVSAVPVGVDVAADEDVPVIEPVTPL